MKRIVANVAFLLCLSCQIWPEAESLAEDAERETLQTKAAEISIVEVLRAASVSWEKVPAVVCIGLRIDSESEIDAPSETVATIQASIGLTSNVRPMSKCQTHPVFGHVMDEDGRPAWMIIYSDVDVVLKENGAEPPPERRAWEQRREFNQNRAVPPSFRIPLPVDNAGIVQFDGVTELSDGFDTEWSYLDFRSKNGAISIVHRTRERLIH